MCRDNCPYEKLVILIFRFKNYFVFLIFVGYYRHENILDNENFRIYGIYRAALLYKFPYDDVTTVSSRLSEHLLSVSGHLDVDSRRHVFGTSGENTLRSLEFCYRKKQSCCTNDFPERCNAFSMQYGI